MRVPPAPAPFNQIRQILEDVNLDFWQRSKWQQKKHGQIWFQDNESIDQAQQTDEQEATVRSRGSAVFAGQLLKWYKLNTQWPILHPQWILRRVPASGTFINSFPKKDKGTMNAFTEAESGQENTQLPELQLSSAPNKPLYTFHGHSGFLHEYNLCNSPNMSEHIKLTQTRYSQLLVVEHGLKTSQDSSH